MVISLGTPTEFCVPGCAIPSIAERISSKLKWPYLLAIFARVPADHPRILPIMGSGTRAVIRREAPVWRRS